MDRVGPAERRRLEERPSVRRMFQRMFSSRPRSKADVPSLWWFSMVWKAKKAA